MVSAPPFLNLIPALRIAGPGFCAPFPNGKQRLFRAQRPGGGDAVSTVREASGMFHFRLSYLNKEVMWMWTVCSARC